VGVRILLVHHAWPTESTGGSEVQVAALATRLTRDHEVAVLHRSADPARPDHDVRESEEDGLRRFSLNNLHRDVPGFEAFRDPGAAAAAARVMDSVRPDVVHVHHLAGLSTGLVFEARRRAAVVFTLHDFATLCPLGQFLTLKEHVCAGPSPRNCLACVGAQVALPAVHVSSTARRAPFAASLASLLARVGSAGERRIAERLEEMHEVLRTADVLVSPSRFLAERLAALGVPGIEVLDYGHAPLSPIRRVADPEGRVRFGFVGSVIPSKGVHVLAEAYRLLADPRARLRIHGPFVPYHGDTGYRERVRALLGSEADAILEGAFDHDRVGEILAGIDVLVVPSLWEENRPLTLTEARLAGIPVVVSDHGGLAEMVLDGEDGLRFRPGDPQALAGVLRRLLDEPALRSRLGAAAPSVPTLDALVAGLLPLYAKARHRWRARAGRVGVVVLDRGRPEDALRAARSALDPALSPRVVIVENGPGSLPPATADIEVLSLPVNRGFAGGMNAGIDHLRRGGCDRILLLNNDAELDAGCLRRLAEALEDEHLAAVGPVILRESDGRVESRGGRFDARSGRHRLAGHGEALRPREGRVKVEALSGAVLMLSGAALDRVGLLDESYFLAFEDMDWCLRASRAGLGLAVVLGARARHAGSRTLGAASPERLYYGARNQLRVAERLHPLAGPARWLRRGAILGLNLAHALRQGEVPRPAGLRAVLAGALDFSRGRSGPRPEAP
jgi:GT2 family glycosyltransferase/glycosyltransferase involved in cell wall biosynthesis